jgi:hypothetical protein
MQMSKQKHLALFLFVLLVAVFLPPLLAVAQDDPPAEPQPTPITIQTQPAEPEVETERSGIRQPGQQATEQTDPATGTTARTLKEFKPTDKIGADSAVSFPVDI